MKKNNRRLAASAPLVYKALHDRKIFTLRQLSKALGIDDSTFQYIRKHNPDIARLTEHLVRWHGPNKVNGGIEGRVAVIEEAKRAGKVRTIRDALIISGIHWQAHKKYMKEHDGWRRVMSDVAFGTTEKPRTVWLTGHRTHVYYTNFVRENEKKGVPQPEASWRAVDRAMKEVEKYQKKKAADLRIKKWGDAAWDVAKKRVPFTRKEARDAAKRRFGHMVVYNFLRAITHHTGQTVDEVAADGATVALRKKYFAAIAECRDKKSAKESAARLVLRRKERAERESRAAKLRKRPDLVRTGNRKKYSQLRPGFVDHMRLRTTALT